MTDIEQKALAMVNNVFAEGGGSPIDYASLIGAGDVVTLALCRAIEQHEAFRQEVSDAVVHCHACSDPEVWRRIKFELDRFIIHAPKPDPLVDAAKMMGYFNTAANAWAEDVRAALDALGFEIREKNDD